MAKKMKLITEDEYKALVAHSIPKGAVENSFVSKEQQKDILLNASNIPDDIKLALYMNISRECQNQIDQIHKNKISVGSSTGQVESASNTTKPELPEEKNHFQTSHFQNLWKLYLKSIEKQQHIFFGFAKKMKTK